MKNLMLCIFVLIISATIYGQSYSGGSGTAEDPYQIANKTDLKYLSEHSDEWGKHFKQTADITFSASDFQSGGDFYNSGEGFIPIGNFGTPFTGSYDGDWHTIDGLYISRSSTDHVGLFGWIDLGAEVKNIGIINTNITGNNDVGGLVGYNYGSVSNSYSTGSVSGSGYNVGGLVGYNYNSTVSNSYSTVSVSSSGGYVGGLVGQNYHYSTISNSYSTGSVSGSNGVGGLVGDNSYSTISNSYSTGSQSGSSGVGGLVGVTSSSVVSNSFWDITASGQSLSAGGTGINSSQMTTASTFNDAGWSSSFWFMDSGFNNGYPYLAWQNSGGTPLIGGYSGGRGTSEDPFLVTNATDLFNVRHAPSSYFKQTTDIDLDVSPYNTGSGWEPIGTNGSGNWFEGYYDGNGHTISNLFINRSSTNFVGLFGSIFNGEIKDLGLIDVNVTGQNHTGAVVGLNYSDVIRCYSTGSVNGDTYVGGLVGSNESSGGSTAEVTNCYTTAAVSSSDYGGGLIGRLTSGNITNSYSVGSVSTNNSNGGGFLGYYTSGTISNSFWNSDSAGTTGIGSGSTTGVTGKTTSEMKTASTFTAVGWSSSFWFMGSGFNNGYPYLEWQNPGGTPLIYGGGTSEDPYLIANKTDLRYLSENSGEWSKYFKQTADITFSASDFQSGGDFYNSGEGFIPIGNGSTQFTGSYDGDGHTIDGLYISRSSTDFVGLFGWINSGATVKNIGVINADITGHNDVGGLVGQNDDNSTISSSYSTGSVSGSGSVGGLVGYSFSTVSNSFSTGSVSGSDYVGGLVGGARNTSTISNSYSTGSVSGSSSVGGLVGINAGSVSNSFWDTETSGQSSSAGGTGRTTTEMKTASTFNDAGWSTSIWKIGDGINNGYPYLAWQNPGGSPLPVELNSFTATINDSKVELKWNTATEVNNYGFEVQKKIDNSQLTMNNWEKVGFIKGSGNSNSRKSYSFVDENPTNGKIEYRLKQIDSDGRYKYSNIINVDVKNIPSEFSLDQNFPNPFNPATAINFALPVKSNVRLSVYNTLGEKVATLVNGELPAGNHSVNFDGSRLSSGVYIYSLKAGNNYTAIKKMILMK